MKKDVLQEIALSTLSIDDASQKIDSIVSILYNLIDALNEKTKNTTNYIDLIDAISIKYKEMNYLFSNLADIGAELGNSKQQIYDAINNATVQEDTETNNKRKQ